MKFRLARHVVLPTVLLGVTLVSWRLLAQDGKILRQRFDQLDKNTDKKLSSEELSDRAIFAKLDANSDGFVTLDEATSAFKAGTLTREEVEGRPAKKPEPDPISSKPEAGNKSTDDDKKNLRQSASILRPADHGVGRYVADVKFSDLEGVGHSLGDYKEKCLVVVAMTSTSCPLSKKYLPSLVELAGNYTLKNVQFIAVNCVPTDRVEDMKAAAASLGDAVCYVHDADESLSKHFRVLTTTDVIVLDQARTVVYHGAIDDQYGIGYALDAPKHRFLAEALDDLLAGRTPEVAATMAPGCTIEPDEEIVAESSWTYHNRISRIIQANCLECHRAGGVGPFSLETHADLVGHAGMIRQVVEGRTMPPWFAGKSEDKHSTVWANDRSLTESDRADLLAWLDSDKPEGDPADAPRKRHFVDGWTIGTPDLVVQIPEPIRIKATGTMPYQFVTAQTTLEEDKWVQGYEIVPTDRSVVHHVIVNVHEKGAGRIRDREEGIGGYWAAYVPGNSSQLYPDGFARKLPAGATVSFQIHYTPSGTATQDQLKMGLVFAKTEPKYVITTLSLADTDLNIPPHTADHVETITRPVPMDVNVMAYMAHMHVRGRSFNFELIKPNGETETLLDIPQYDFNWQLRYDYREPRVVPAGSRVKVTAVFDNSEDNPANPDPTKTVHWGQQTFDEMMIGYVETFAPIGEERPTFRRSIGDGQALFKVLDTDADGKLSKDEATRAADRVPRLRDNPGILDRLFERNDADKDNQLSQDEFDNLRQQIAGRG